MKKLLMFIICLIILFSGLWKNAVILEVPALQGTVSEYYDENGTKYIYVKGYTKKNGTEVKGYYRSLPDKNKDNNLSQKGNINPFTGKKGRKKN